MRIIFCIVLFPTGQTNTKGVIYMKKNNQKSKKNSYSQDKNFKKDSSKNNSNCPNNCPNECSEEIENENNYQDYNLNQNNRESH